MILNCSLDFEELISFSVSVHSSFDNSKCRVHCVIIAIRMKADSTWTPWTNWQRKMDFFFVHAM